MGADRYDRGVDGRMSKAFALAFLACITGIAASHAGEFGPMSPDGITLCVDWQLPDFLPPRFRNHCAVENFTGRPYCSEHCGMDYQVYYCSEGSFGCCRLGHGYCDF